MNINMKQQTVCFTGHREIREKDIQLKETCKKNLEKLILQGFRYFGAGGARGFDLLAAETVITLKNIYLILVLPFINQYQQEQGWSDGEIEKYQYLKTKASKIVYIQKDYSSGCYYKRNRHLIDCSSVCVCYQYKNTGGTAYTTKYAIINGLKLINCVDTINFSN